MKSLRRKLECLASLSGQDALMSAKREQNTDPIKEVNHLNSVQVHVHTCTVQTTNSFPTQPHNGTRTLQVNYWQECTRSRWVLRTVQFGYNLQFATCPLQFKGIIHSQVQGGLGHVLQEKITSLLNERAVKVVPPKESQLRKFLRFAFLGVA